MVSLQLWRRRTSPRIALARGLSMIRRLRRFLAVNSPLNLCMHVCWQYKCMPEPMTEAAVMQRVRRACQQRKSGKIPAGEEGQKLWRDVENRNEMCRMLIDSNFKMVRALNHDDPYHDCTFPFTFVLLRPTSRSMSCASPCA